MNSCRLKWPSWTVLVYCLAWVAACSHEHDLQQEGDRHPEEEHQDTPRSRGHVQDTADEHETDQQNHLDPATLEQIGVRTVEVQPVDYAPSVKIPGEIRIDPDRRVIISAPVGARVLALDVPPHATVRAGRRLVLLELTDTDIRHQQIRAVEVRTELLAARTERDRTRAYLKALQAQERPAGAERQRVRADLEVQEAKVRSRESALEAILASLKLAGFNPAQLEALEKRGQVTTRISLYPSRLPGNPEMEAIARPVKLGQNVVAGTRLYELVVLDRLQVVGEAFEADLPLVRQAAKAGRPVGLLFPATRRTVAGLKIYTVEGALDGESRVAHFFMWLPNRKLTSGTHEGHAYSDWEYRAGERVQVLVPEKRAEPRFVLPVEALVRTGGRQWVFRECHSGCDRVAVQVETIEERRAIIPLNGGLSPGDRVVVSGALQVHLAMQKPDADTGHGHRH